jgi:hypothetical protein
VTQIGLNDNRLGKDGAAALADALEVNTSVSTLELDGNGIDESNRAIVDALVARNKRFRSLFLFDARQMLMSRLCSDEFGVLCKYFIASSAGKDDGAAPDDIESIRVELAAVVNERRRRELCRPALVSDVRKVVSEQTNQMTTKFTDQTNQIADLQRSAQMLVERNEQMQEQERMQEQMQEQMRQMHALLMAARARSVLITTLSKTTHAL